MFHLTRSKHLYYLDWFLIRENTQCVNAMQHIHKNIQSTSECAARCQEVSSMFVFQEGNGNCGCAVDAKESGTCNMEKSIGRNLYRYGNQTYMSSLLIHFSFL